MGKNNKKALLRQKSILSRMNFLHQAGMLMAGTNNTLSAYYGKLCRRIGTRSTQRIHPTVKRNMCKRCSIAVVPSVTAEMSSSSNSAGNNKIASAGEDVKNEPENEPSKPQKEQTKMTSKTPTAKSASRNIDANKYFQQKCIVCGYERRFLINSKYHLWTDDPNAIGKTTILTQNNRK